MLFEILTSAIAGGIAATAYFKQQGVGDDKAKIERIAANVGLVTKDGKQIRIYRRSKGDGFTEYVFQIPLGLSFADFERKSMHSRMASILNVMLSIYLSQTSKQSIFAVTFSNNSKPL